MIKLGVNIDHIATVRNARAEGHPNIVYAAKQVMSFGASSVTVHLREDRRHINDLDLKSLTSLKKKIPINLEIAANKKMLKLALKYKPKFVCLVPEKRKELTTEGGLNIKKNFKVIKSVISELNKKKIRTSLFINPSIEDIKLSKKINTKCIELHTGNISRIIKNKSNYKKEFKKILLCCKLADSLNIEVHAGHGMDYKTAKLLSRINEIKEFNIGHFIIGESIFIGLKKVIKKFKSICN